MNFLQLVQLAMRESGVTQSDPAPSTLVGAQGLTLKFANWVMQAYEEFQIENDTSEFRRSWFATTIKPRFYFDMDGPGSALTTATSFTGLTTGFSFDFESKVITNGGTYSDGSAQGFFEFSNLVGQPVTCEVISAQNSASTRNPYRFLRWGDYRLSDTNEMGDSAIVDLEDLWWDTLKIQQAPNELSPTTKIDPSQTELQFVDYSYFLNKFDNKDQTLGRPQIITEAPDDGSRLIFWPPPDQNYILSGYYTKAINQFNLQQPATKQSPIELKTMYHAMLAWRAVWYYGEDMHDPQTEAKGKKRYMVYKKKLDDESRVRTVMRPIQLW